MRSVTLTFTVTNRTSGEGFFPALVARRTGAPPCWGRSFPPCSWLPNNTLEVQILPTWEILYNHYGGRKGRSMPSTAALLPRVRAGGQATDLQMSWETLTHAGVGSVGLP